MYVVVCPHFKHFISATSLEASSGILYLYCHGNAIIPDNSHCVCVCVCDCVCKYTTTVHVSACQIHSPVQCVFK